MPDYLILKAYPNAFSHIIPGKIWDGNNGKLYDERDLEYLTRNFPYSTRNTKYGVSYYFKSISPFSAEAR